MGVDGVPVAPNNIGVYLSPADFERFDVVRRRLARELAEVAREHAREEGYQFVGSVDGHARPRRRAPRRRVRRRRPRSRAGGGSGRSCCPTAAGCRSARPCSLGRLPECDVVVADPQASRRHAEIRPAGNGFLLVDLGSMNGTRVNGAAIGEHVLVDGDEIGLGATEFRFEAS